jgi:hypothetical protein
MAITVAQTTEVAQVLADLLATVEGLRVEPYVSDKSRPPVAVVALPTITWDDPEAGFCWASWEFPITVITARNSDRDAQADLSRLVRDVAGALNHAPVAGVHDIQLLDARPTTATIAGQELPAYQVRVKVLA